MAWSPYGVQGVPMIEKSDGVARTAVEASPLAASALFVVVGNQNEEYLFSGRGRPAAQDAKRTFNLCAPITAFHRAPVAVLISFHSVFRNDEHDVEDDEQRSGESTKTMSKGLWRKLVRLTPTQLFSES